MSYLKVIFLMQAALLANCQLPEQTTHATAAPLLGQKKIFEQPPLRLDACPLNDDAAHPIQLPYPSDCSKYYSCLKGYAYLLSCPVGLYWSTLTYRCDYPAVAKCQNQPQPQPQPQPPPSPYNPDNHHSFDYYLPYAGDCHKYFQCQLVTCPPQYAWNANLQRCDYAANYPNCNGNYQPTPPAPTTPPTPPPSPPTAATPPPTYVPWPTEPTLPANFTTIPIDINQNELNKLCEMSNGRDYIPYPNDCHRFIQCNGMAFVQWCPPELYWNSQAKTCDYFCV